MLKTPFIAFRLLLLLLLMVTGATAVHSQVYNNEWIKYSNTYYKFKIGNSGVYRLPASLLQTNGLAATPVEQFHLFRNGTEVPLYTSISAGALPPDGYIEFLGQANDGAPDRPLYLNTAYQHTQANSLFTDSATYFLTVDATPSRRFLSINNNVSTNTLPAETYFMYTQGNYYKSIINPGVAADIDGTYFYSSAFDRGEFWSSNDIREKASMTENLNNLQVAAEGPDVTFRFGGFGNTARSRRVQLTVNNSMLKDTAMNYFTDAVMTATFSPSLIASNSAAITFLNTHPSSSTAVDRMVISFFEMTYPRRFSFGNSNRFSFVLDAKSQGHYLEITDFNAGGVAPVLYDTETQERYVANTEVSGRYRFALRPSASTRRLTLVSQASGNITTVTTLQQKVFRNLSVADNQANFLIISNSRLYNGADGKNPVEDYRVYRSSAAGGAYQAQVYDIDELTDQFAFGIYGHPSAVKNFISYARTNWNSNAKAFLIGKGVIYRQFRTSPSTERPRLREQNLVPTFGHPGSDNLLATSSASNPIALTDIGRLSAISPEEVANYLEKVIEYEKAQQNSSNRLADKLWMKNVVHVTGASDALLGTALCNYMNEYRQIITDTLVGASATVLCKTVSGSSDQAGAAIVKQKLEEGTSLLTYFGHSSASTLEFSIADPQEYNNQGKYPVFSVNGCYAGNFFDFSDGRFQTLETLTEKYVLTKQRGAIAFIASTHYGVSNYLHNYLTYFYNRIGKSDYGKSISRASLDGLADIVKTNNNFDFLGRAHAEQITYHGDPALMFNFQAKPDYVVEESSVKITPNFVSISDQQYQVQVTIYNQGKATRDSVSVEVSRVSPAGTTFSLYNQKIGPIKYMDSLVLTLPIEPLRDKGQNFINVRLDGSNRIEEIDENNNYVSRSYFIYEDEASPVYPYNYSIVSEPVLKLYASTADPLRTIKQYVLEIDTTSLFNSVLKRSVTISSTGGLLEFNPQMSMSDSTVYYWRVSTVPPEGGEFKWNQFSFLFKQDVDNGFNQSHFYQHRESDLSRIQVTDNRQWVFANRVNSLIVKQGLYPTSANEDIDLSVMVNEIDSIRSACLGNSLLFNVFDPISFRAWKNVDESGNNLYRFGSAAANCKPSRYWNFEFSYLNAASRKTIMDFMDSIPAGYYVVVRSFDAAVPQSYSATWLGDTSLYGANNTLYHKLLAVGFTTIDSVFGAKCWAGVYKKGATDFDPQFRVSRGAYDKVNIIASPETPGTNGMITSPAFGPSKKWQKMIWRGHSLETVASPDHAVVDLVGITTNNTRVPLKTIQVNEWETDISDVDAAVYPYLELKMSNSDSTNHTPYQLDYWRLMYQPVPEGAIAPNLYLLSKDTLDFGETAQFGVAFKNISATPFDSLKMKFILTDANNVPHQLVVDTLKPLVAGDTVIFRYSFDPRSYPGANVLYIDFNPDNHQPEQFHFNNILYKTLYVRTDNTNPLLDVTFDGVHILNGDIVSAKPRIVIKLKDENKFTLLTKDSLMRVQVRYPDQTVRTFKVDGDTLRFTPATSAADNTATLDFNPAFLQQFDQESGIDYYQLMVSGRDMADNPAGIVQYSINFTVINKPMISNLLNYPNPFSTSTAFVFTLTGSEIPTNFKIQILTVTGKVVREITGPELGPLRIGRNITEFKWDGTDQFGQRLANGVYLYRVVTMLNGKSLDKYRAQGDNTDKFFNKGYGKMYLIK